MRDLIPQIIREDGAKPVTYIAGREEYRGRLRDKLGEEVAEFLEADEDSAPDPGLAKREVPAGHPIFGFHGSEHRRSPRG